MPHLFDPITLGQIPLATRVVMAPLTRNRAPGQVPNDLMVQYYRQRANPATGAGLIVTEATPISPMGHGYLDTPGVYTPEQVAAWQRVTDAVHAEGGRIVVQLWHVGRISHSSLLPGGAAPVSSTAVRAQAKTFIATGFEDVSAPRALATEEIPAIVADYAHATRCALDAGFDGVEIHAANNYLIEQFLRDSVNDRTDRYGGSIDNRTRFLAEVLDAVVGVAGAGRTGIRLSPTTPGNGAALDSDPQALYGHVADLIAARGLAFAHVIEGQTGGARDFASFDFAALRTRLKVPYIANNAYTREMAIAAVERGAVDAVAFGKAFIANPDLGLRLRRDAPLNPLDAGRLYGGGAQGYIDYPTLETI